MKNAYILAIDQGTTGSRAIIFDSQCRVKATAYKEFKQYYPKPGWVEHDADEIWASVNSVIRSAVKKARIKKDAIKAIGITNQRETTVLWNRKTSKPVGRAIVWQCRRTAEFCKSKNIKKHAGVFRSKTGLVLDPYFSGTKIRWMLDHKKGLRQLAKKGNLCFGTIDSWLIWKLTGGQSHVTDMTNASRTLIFNIKTKKWDKTLLKILNIPENILPNVQNSGSHFGKTAGNIAGLPNGMPIASVLGDQQAALYGQGCFASGSVKNTYGTGSFIVLNTGKKLVYSKKGLLSTIASDDQGKPIYALEGSIFIAGAVIQWLRDELKVIKDSKQSENLIRNVKDNHGVYFVPAFAGLGAPYWNPDARGIIVGLTRGANVKHITRAALESIAYQTKDVIDVMKSELRKSIKELKVDGGACKNNFLMQFQADLLNCRVIRPKMVELTALGAAQLAGITVGIWKGKRDLLRLYSIDKKFKSTMKSTERNQLYNGWLKAVQKALHA